MATGTKPDPCATLARAVDMSFGQTANDDLSRDLFDLHFLPKQPS